MAQSSLEGVPQVGDAATDNPHPVVMAGEELERALARSANAVVKFWLDFSCKDPGEQAKESGGTTDDMEKQREEAFREWHRSLADIKAAGLIVETLEKDVHCATAALVVRFLLHAALRFRGGMRKAAMEDLGLVLQVPSWSGWIPQGELESLPPDCRYLLCAMDNASANASAGFSSTSDSDQPALEGAERDQQGDDWLRRFIDMDREHSREVEERVKKSLGDVNEKVCADGARIVIMGNSGAGKSSCINAAFHKDLAATGVGVSVTSDITHYPATTDCPIHIYDTKGFESTTNNEDVKLQMQHLAQQRREAASRLHGHPDSVPERLHAVWWVIDVGAGGRFNPGLMKVVHDVFDGDSLPIFIVINKCDLGDATYVLEIQRSVQEHCPWAAAVVPVVANAQLGPMMQQCPCGSSDIMINRKKRYHVCETCDRHVPFKQCYGIDALIRETADNIPEMVVLSLLTAQKEWLHGLDRSASHIVAGFTFTAAGIGAAPLPFMSRCALVPLHLAMAAAIAKVYDIIVSTKTSVHVLLSAGSTALLGTLGCWAANVLKAIPVLAPLGYISDASISAIVTASLGKLFQTIFSKVRGKALLVGEVQPEDIDRVMSKEERKRVFREYLERFAAPIRELMTDITNMSPEHFREALDRSM